MRVSVVVPTYKRPDSLRRCLDALARQLRAPDEVLIVARREDDASRAVAHEHRELVRLVSIDVPAGRPGFVMALNAGVAASTGEIVALTDDDAEPRPDWLSRIIATFDTSPQIGAVGGRDWVHIGDRPIDGEEEIVGLLRWWGSVTGNHHLGAGSPRDVSVLKGVNLSARGELIRQVGFDTRLLGIATEHHSELGLCLTLSRMGYRIVYDPAIAVDHRPQPRVEEKREYGEREVRNAAHNETLALLEHLPRRRQAIHLAWVIAVGTRGSPGFASSLRQLLSSGDARAALLRGNLAGRRQAIGTYLRSRPKAPARSLRSRPRAPARCARQRGDSGDSTPPRPRVLSIPHSPGAAERAEQLLGGVPGVELTAPPPGARGMALSAWSALSSRATVLYLVDVGKSTTVAAVLGRLTRKRVILDTGDACYALAASLGDRGFAGLALVGLGEQLALRSAHEIVVRGRAHAGYVPGRATHIPDLPPAGAGPVPAGELRRTLDLDGAFVIGVVGSLIFSPRLRISYGWDLIEALSHTAPEVLALIVGDGSGLEPLQTRARELGVIDRCRFVGRVPTDLVSQYVCATDIAISTQTNDLVGQVRTTGKLPLYLACARPVLASHVGEAARLLGPKGWTIPYSGVIDRLYPKRLAEAIERWRGDPGGAESRRAIARKLAESEFDVEVMRRRLALVIDGAPEPA